MPKYLVEGRYTSDGLTGLAREGVSRRRADIAKMIDSPLPAALVCRATSHLLCRARPQRPATRLFLFRGGAGGPYRFFLCDAGHTPNGRSHGTDATSGNLQH
jgi:hypothetical protein